MRQEDFREFERFCIRYDIAIDEEECWRQWTGIGPQDTWPLHLSCLKELARPHDGYFRQVIADHLPELAGKLGIVEGWDEDQSRLILCKRVRGVIQQSKNSEYLDSLDALAEYLIREMPSVPAAIPVSSQPESDAGLRSLVMRILYLNEISQCYRGFLSIGYADRCLDLIKDALKDSSGRSTGKGKTPYELVALFNKGVGYFHTRSRFEEALAEFEKVIEADSAGYFELSTPVWLRWTRNDFDSLFYPYVIVPSFLMAADACIKMQRASEAHFFLDDLARRGIPEDSYAWYRAEILRQRLESDRGDFRNRVRNEAEPVKNEVKMRTEEVLRGNRCRSIDSLQRSVLVEQWRQIGEYHLDRLRLAQDGDAECKDSDKCDATEACKALEYAERLVKAQWTHNVNDKPEVDQSLLLWAEALPMCAELLTIASKTETAADMILRTVEAYVGLTHEWQGSQEEALQKLRNAVIDEEYRVHHDEIREKYVEGLKSLFKALTNAGSAWSGREDLKVRIDGMRSTVVGYLGSVLKYLGGCRSMSEAKRAYYRHLETHVLEQPSGLPHETFRKALARQFFHTDKKWGHCGRSCWRFDKYKCSRCPSFKASEMATAAYYEGEDAVHYYDAVLERNRQEIGQLLYAKRSVQRPPSGWGFLVLKRWNSYTPAVTLSEGGGYFLYHVSQRGEVDLGIVIDPGYEFMKSFIRQGFGVRDITAVFVSHDHPDHVDDFGKITNLLKEVKKKRGQRKEPISSPPEYIPVTLGLSRGAFRRLLPVIATARDVFRDTQVLDARKPSAVEVSSPDGRSSVQVSPRVALHEDASGYDAVGLLVEIRHGDDNVPAVVGLPGDTRWDPRLGDIYGDCDLVCAHLDCIAPEDFRLRSYFDDRMTASEVLCDKQQLYLPGLVSLLHGLARRGHRSGKNRLLVISEFGEEMCGGLRVDLAQRLSNCVAGRRLPVVPADIGLTIDPCRGLVQCSICRLFFEWNTSFGYRVSGQEERIWYLCPQCASIDFTDRRDLGAV